MKAITPKHIRDAFLRRLRDKSDDVEYLSCTNRQFEKWLQCELILSLSKDFIPAIYDESGKEIYSEEYSDSRREQICDISIEYPLGDKDSDIRTDVCVAERPFLFKKHADNLNWKILETTTTSRIMDDYEETGFHHIELKHMPWVEVNATGYITRTVLNDIEKYTEQDWRTFKRQYNPKCVISLVVILFNNSSLSSNTAFKRALNKNMNIIMEEIKHKLKKQKIVAIVDWKQIKPEFGLLMTYFDASR